MRRRGDRRERWRFDYRVAAGGPLIDDKLGLRGAHSKAEFDGTWRNSLPAWMATARAPGSPESETYSLKAVLRQQNGWRSTRRI